MINDNEIGNTDRRRNNSWMYIVFVCLRAIYIVFLAVPRLEKKVIYSIDLVL